MMTSGALIRWSRLHERRARKLPGFAIAVALGLVLAAWVSWRTTAGVAAASSAWLAGAIVGFAVAFLRVPFHIYWRADAPLLAQLPLEGQPLFDAALVRCLAAAAGTTLAAVIGALPLAWAGDLALAARHAGYAGALGAAAGLLLPAVTVGAAAVVVHGEAALKAATALGGAPVRERGDHGPADRAPGSQAGDPSGTAPGRAASVGPPPGSPAAILGALPGFAATIVMAAVLIVRSWLADGEHPQAPAVLIAIAAISAAAALAARRGAAVMAHVLRDVSALDRQRLATLEIKPPTRIESAIAALIGEARLPYRKDAQLMRRRFPVAFALGALCFVVLVIVGLVRPDDPTPWLTIAIGGAAAYGLVLAGRLRRPPIELARLSATLPLSARAHAHARLAWLLGWWTIFAGAPGAFAALRQSEPAIGLALTGGATIAIIVAGALRR